MRGHYACLPACLSAFGSLIMPGRYDLRKKPPKKGVPSRSLRSVKPLATAKMHQRIGERKSLFFSSASLASHAQQHAPELCCAPLSPLPNMMPYAPSTPSTLLLVYVILRHTCFEPLAPTPPPHSGWIICQIDPGWMAQNRVSLRFTKKRTKGKVYLRTMQSQGVIWLLEKWNKKSPRAMQGKYSEALL